MVCGRYTSESDYTGVIIGGDSSAAQIRIAYNEEGRYSQTTIDYSGVSTGSIVASQISSTNWSIGVNGDIDTSGALSTNGNISTGRYITFNYTVGTKNY